jgi:hypothetical protein
VFAQYAYSQAFSDTDGPGSFPANQFDLSTEYGRSGTDVRHRFFLSGMAKGPFGMQFSPFIVVRYGFPFNITTGRDPMGIRYSKSALSWRRFSPNPEWWSRDAVHSIQTHPPHSPSFLEILVAGRPTSQ